MNDKGNTNFISSTFPDHFTFNQLEVTTLDQQNFIKLRVRTANHDNYRDRRDILQIFHSQYGRSHPLPHVLTEEFWAMPENYLAGEGLTSLLIENVKNGESIAHIALAFREGDSHAEILLPAIKKSWQHALGIIFKVFQTKIKTLSQRRNWSHYVAVCITSDPFYQYIATSFFDCQAVALLPSNNNSKDAIDKNFALLLYGSIKATKYKKPIYIQNELNPIIWQIIKSLGYATYKNKNTECVLYRHKKRFKVQINLMYNLTFLDIFPSNIKLKMEISQIISKILIPFKSLPIIRLHLSDKLTPNYTECLIDIGYKLCGVDIISGELVLMLANICGTDLRQVMLYGAGSNAFRDIVFNSKI